MALFKQINTKITKSHIILTLLLFLTD